MATFVVGFIVGFFFSFSPGLPGGGTIFHTLEKETCFFPLRFSALHSAHSSAPTHSNSLVCPLLCRCHPCFLICFSGRALFLLTVCVQLTRPKKGRCFADGIAFSAADKCRQHRAFLLWIVSLPD